MIQKKICLLGASSVGKTSLVKQFVDGIFNEKYLTTIGVKVDRKTLSIANTELNFMLWDMEGNDSYNVFQERYLRGAAGYIIVVDQTRASSLHEGIDIHTLARQVTTCPAILAVNKNDLPATWHFDDSEYENYKRLFDLNFSTSAKTGSNVEEMFSALASLLLRLEKNDITS
ncbi:small GTP-binding protein domain-containing protein [Colwellia chukchiensis]|uniref:Small GTP-binding protein domain-containing protein n=1 Tax=Colwellia chukchiensis TaxID=641665 RepID=A0A1H7SVM6_9GAMM|nr:Rab family GTPase [Colwellia chukchiensis]SEL76359.1 small GTP-binding protein domain-containing protein [Colwellia chukchiensis]